MDRKNKPEVYRGFRLFFTLAGKTKLRVFEGEFEGDSPRSREMSAKLTEGTDPIRAAFSKSSALNKFPITLLYERRAYFRIFG